MSDVHTGLSEGSFALFVCDGSELVVLVMPILKRCHGVLYGQFTQHSGCDGSEITTRDGELSQVNEGAFV